MASNATVGGKIATKSLFREDLHQQNPKHQILLTGEFVTQNTLEHDFQ
jgi:hypothetical protein